MKRMVAIFLTVFLLAGCSRNGSIDGALVLREQLLKCNSCSFDAQITADYGEKIYSFTLHCQTDKNGDLTFTVTEPKTIQGITGKISNDSGSLTFDDQILAFEMIADGQITPVSAPWLMVRTLRSGYIAYSGEDGSNTRVRFDDSYREDAIQLDIWLNENNQPLRCEILWQGRRVVSLDVKNFSCV